MTIVFTASDPYSIGMEMEFQLLNSESLELVDGIMPLLDFYPDTTNIKPEFIQNTVELASDVCFDLIELEANIRALFQGLSTRCQSLGIALCSAGTHAFDKKLATITPFPRFRAMERAEGYSSHIQITFATHVHIGMRSGDEAVNLMSRLMPYLPLLIAISASSPFWRGHDTGYASYRQRILGATRSYGMPPSFSNWEEFCHFFETAKKIGVFETIRDIHWDIRPRPELGTLEVRVMDAQPTIREAIDLAGVVRALVMYLRRTPIETDQGQAFSSIHWWVQKDNQYQASHHGLDANYLEALDAEPLALRALLAKVMARLAPVAEEMQQSSSMASLRTTLEHGISNERQHAVYQRTGSCKKIVERLVEELAADSCHAPLGARIPWKESEQV